MVAIGHKIPEDIKSLATLLARNEVNALGLEHGSHVEGLLGENANDEDDIFYYSVLEAMIKDGYDMEGMYIYERPIDNVLCVTDGKYKCFDVVVENTKSGDMNVLWAGVVSPNGNASFTKHIFANTIAEAIEISKTYMNLFNS